MEYSVREATGADLVALHDVISTTGWGITRESIQAIQTWDPGAYAIAEDADGKALGVAFGLGFIRTGWIGHVVVRPECQGAGLGRALFERVLGRLTKRGRSTVYLTATVMGQPLYAKFGFVPDGGWSRWRGTVPARMAVDPPADGVGIMREDDLADVVSFDTARFGDDRGVALRWLFQAYPGGGRILRRPDGTVCGYLLRGTEGLGPFVAEDDGVRSLFAAALAMFAGREVEFTFPDDNLLAPELCREAGLAPFRTWLRMRLGPDANQPRDRCIFNASVAKG